LQAITSLQKSTYYFYTKSDHGNELDKKEFIKFYNDFSIFHNFSTSRTPQQNSVVEKKHRTLKDMTRTLLCESNLSPSF